MTIKRFISSAKNQQKKGFTLSELLVSLAILGIIFSITIPMMAMQRENSAKVATMRETMFMIYDIVRPAVQSEELLPSNFSTYVLSKMNATHKCPTNSSTEGCWNTTLQGTFAAAPYSVPEHTEPGAILPNGVRIIGLGNTADAQGVNSFIVDWNGEKTPNTIGKDQLYISLCFDSKAAEGVCASNIKHGTMAASIHCLPSTDATCVKNQTLFTTVVTK